MGSGVTQKQINQKGGPGEKNSELGKKSVRKTADHVNCPLGDSFIPSMKSQNGGFWMVHWWVLGH
jgi:hypothetical protein